LFTYELTDGKVQIAESDAVTFTDAGDLVGLVAHGLIAGTAVAFSSITTTTGITTSTKYYVIGTPGADSFQIGATPGGSAVVLTGNGSGVMKTLAEIDLLYANKIEIEAEEQTITWAGDGQQRSVYVTRGMTATLPTDCLSVAAAARIFNKTPVTANLPAGLTTMTYFGEPAETGGVSAGLWAEGYAIRRNAISGAEDRIDMRLWIMLGTLTLGGAPGLATGEKSGQMVYKLGAVRSTVDVTGTALPGVPSGGAFYAIGEK